MADDLTSLFSPDSTPTPPASPEADLLRQQLSFQNQLLSQVMTQKEKPPETGPVAPPQWQDQEFISPDDARLILDSPGDQLHQRLNRAVNTAVKTVHERMQDEIRRRDEQIASTRAELDSRWQALESQRAADFWQQSFYGAHADLKEDPDLVQQATRVVADYVAKNPWAAQNEGQVLNAIAQTARSLRTQKLQRWSATPETEVSLPAGSSPARRAQVESGGSTRVGVARDANPDHQKQAIADMLKHVRGGN